MLDLILLVILIIAAIWGFAKGMVRVLFSLGGYVVAFVVAKLYSSHLAMWFIANSSWDESLSESINSNLQSLVSDGVASKFSMQDIATMPEFTQIKALVQSFASDAFTNNIGMANNGMDFSTAGDTFAYYILLAVSAILLFVVVKILLGIVGSIVQKVLSLSLLLTATDRIVGLVLGSLIGVLLVFFIVSVLTPISLTMVGGGLLDILRESKIATFILESGIYTNLMISVTSGIASIHNS
ncbi:CvpA family protein [Clostridia bacterium]|nr:CvpA family protein [Clostridia bacterium]